MFYKVLFGASRGRSEEASPAALLSVVSNSLIFSVVAVYGVRVSLLFTLLGDDVDVRPFGEEDIDKAVLSFLLS